MSISEMTAGILLKLKDQYSSGIRGAGVSTEHFSKKAVAAADKVNKAFSGIAGTLGALGVSVGALGTFKSLMDLDHRMARLGLTANASAKQINEWKRHIFEVATMPDIKIGVDPIIGGLENVMAATGDYDFAYANTENIARLLQASGANGGDVGKVFAEFAKNHFSAEDIQKTLDNMVTQSDMGKFTFEEFAGVSERVMASYSQGKIMTSEDVTRMNGAMQVLRSVTGTAEVAASTLEATMRDLTDADKIAEFKKLGITVRNDATGEMRDFNDIMIDVAKVAEDFAKKDKLNKIFGEQSRRSLIAYQSEFAKNIPRLLELGDTAGTLSEKAAKMANTLSSSFKNLQTAFLSVADQNVSGPMQGLVDLMNYFSEDSKRIETGIKGVAAALAGLAAIKIGAGIVSFVANLKGIKSGGIDIGGLQKATGGAGMPVYVTNWSGQGGPPGTPQSAPVPGGGGLVPTGVTGLDPKSVNAANFAKGARAAGVLTVATVGVTQAVGAYQQVQAIEADTEKTEREKSKAKGGAIGGAVGTTVGTGAGVLAGSLLAGKIGAMVGTAIAPGIGTAIGGAIGLAGGALVGVIGGAIGKKVGESVGDYQGFQAEQRALREEVGVVENVENVQPQKVELEGQAVMDVNVTLTDERVTAEAAVRNNGIDHMSFNTNNPGHAPWARKLYS